MKKRLPKSLLVFFLFGIFLIGCQENEGTPNENTSSNAQPASSDSNSENSNSTSTESSNHRHDHNHSHEDEKQKEIYSGIFEDNEVKDRELSDWEGDWQSVYPYLLDGTLDSVLQKKVETKKDKTFDEYKEYYQVGYETDMERIVIKDNTITFYHNGEGKTGEYTYHGYEILTYESGNRGVRYLFDLVGEADGVPKHVQFSDHSIDPTKAEHYHIYLGNGDHDTLLHELDNWPTYYFSHLSGEEIAEEMNAH
ncbi:metal-binding protein ZinT [Niallia endozanthoxylica]|uniref:Metal-binding protein ZinT n=1 Tax=Niallia endozanthoxylica TaxID=2036016 RepID=A0A5J5I5D2_9BACI|nr:metal-binding protein ZinT [Niallia endozanthoxylica]KAA9030620.1 metal-binding protein ZinT [Niallia endozanthoxylica]